MKSLDPTTQAQITAMIESDPRFQNAKEEMIEVEEGTIDRDLDNYGTSVLRKECKEDMKKRGLLDLVYNEQTGQVEPDQISFYTKVGAFLQDTGTVFATKIANTYAAAINIEDINDKIKELKNIDSNFNAYMNSVNGIIDSRISYHIATFQMSLAANSWKFAAVFKAIGNLETITKYRINALTYNGNYGTSKDVVFATALNIATLFYQRAISKKLEPTDYPDFAALSMEDIYSLANFMVPGLCAMIEFIQTDIRCYKSTMIPGYNTKTITGYPNLISKEINQSLTTAYHEKFSAEKAGIIAKDDNDDDEYDPF